MLCKQSFLYLAVLSTFIFSGCKISGTVVDDFGVGIEGVKVTLSGNVSETVFTDSSGYYQFGDQTSAGLSVGNYTVTPSKDGYSFEPTSRSVEIVNENGNNPNPVANVNFQTVSHSNYKKTALLLGDWIFNYSHSDTAFTRYYYLDTITESTNTPGEYDIWGLDEKNEDIIAGYSPGLDAWTLLDTYADFDRFYVFYTDGSKILGNSCYYQVDPETIEFSACIPFEGNKLASLSSMEVTERSESFVDGESADRHIQTVPFDDDIVNKYFQLKMFLDSQK